MNSQIEQYSGNSGYLLKNLDMNMMVQLQNASQDIEYRVAMSLGKRLVLSLRFQVSLHLILHFSYSKC